MKRFLGMDGLVTLATNRLFCSCLATYASHHNEPPVSPSPPFPPLPHLLSPAFAFDHAINEGLPCSQCEK